MKVFIIALLAFVAYCQALSDEEKAGIQKLYSTCVTLSSVDEDLIKKLRAGEDVSDDNLKKYVGCMFSKLQFINEAGELQADIVKSKIPSDFDASEAERIISECKDIKGEDADGTSFDAYKCFLTKSSKPIIDF